MEQILYFIRNFEIIKLAVTKFAWEITENNVMKNKDK